MLKEEHSELNFANYREEKNKSHKPGENSKENSKKNSRE